MARSPRSPSSEIDDPLHELPDDAGTRRDALWLITQQIHELTGGFSRTEAKTDRLIADVGDLTKEVKELRNSLMLAKGFGLAAVVLIPICATLVWWLVGSRLNNIRDQLYQDRGVLSAPAPAANPTPPHPKN